MLSPLCLAAFLVVSSALPDAETSPLPSGMDLLYGDRVAFRPNGEPLVALGLMTGQKQVRVRADTGFWIDYWEHGTLKRSHVSAGRVITVTVRRSEAAAKVYYVDVEGIDWQKPQLVDWAISGWRARGYRDAEVLEEGSVLGIGGRVIDNRGYRVIIPAKSATEAEVLAQEVYERFGNRAIPRSRLKERPWGELELRLDKQALARATSYVRFSTPGGVPLTVLEVEHSKGYDWHGFADRRYRGEIYAVVDPDGALAAVNVLGVEELLEGVVPSEIFASAAPEALKAQAVAARNTLLAKLGTRHHGDPFHLCAEQHCQVYTGLEREDPRTSRAVAATAGEALFFGSGDSERLVDAVYSSSCGGHTEDNDAVWGDRPNPALRARPDYDTDAHPELAAYAGALDGALAQNWIGSAPKAFCAQASSARVEKFRWEKGFSAAELQKLLRDEPVGRLRDVEIEGRGRGGRVLSLRLLGERGSVSVVHELPIRRLFANLNSGTFVVDVTHDAAGFVERLTFRGGGWGHGVGMCQLGAIGRAEAGHDYARILAAYYNNARLETLYRPLRASR